MKKILVILLPIITFAANAQEKHQLSIGAGYGDYDLKEEFDSVALLGWDAGHYSLGYGYNFSNNWMFELDYYDIEKGSVFENSVFVTSARKTFDLSRRNRAYVKAGVNYYDFTLKGSFRNVNETGLNYAVGIGWQVDFDMGLSLSIELNKMKHSFIDSTFVDYSLSYRF
ncbi:MAG: porin family protein [Paraglaciecola sp.]|uniref:porin family protein n=1 Tax=Paraglaciecola sp. TaxID=1920173 RepID=UPI003298EA13